jgi:uncharacterized protein
MPLGFHLMAKPIGPKCNLNCEYCFYTEKEAFYPHREDYRMSDTVLEAYTRKYIESQDTAEVTFAWQGGEPFLLPLDFFIKAVELQKKYACGKRIFNTIQTNGVLLDDDWCSFLADNNFLVGLSLDGPEKIHNTYRFDHGSKPIFSQVMRGLKLLQKYGTQFNILACVNRLSSRHPRDVYRFLTDQGVQYIQFIPVVERVPNAAAREFGLRLSTPPPFEGDETETQVMPWAVTPDSYGDFLITVFDEWIGNDVGNIFVMNFEWVLNSWVGNLSPICYFSQHCGGSLILEHNGDIYSCDHYMYPKYKLGNILDDDIRGMVESEQQIGFGIKKEETLPRFCKQCSFLKLCRGECPKHRFCETPDGEPGLNYLCSGYKKYFTHIMPDLKRIGELILNGEPASRIVTM